MKNSTQCTPERFFYQVPPKRFRQGLAAHLIALLSGIMLVLIFRSHPLHAVYVDLMGLYGGILCIVLGTGNLALATLTIIGLRQPMLTLNESALIYRKAVFPWKVIAGITYVSLPTGRKVGILLRKGQLRIRPLRSGLFPWYTMEAMLSKDLARYGVIPIPQARSISIEGLHDVITDYFNLAT
jgi:hypothetical protein